MKRSTGRWWLGWLGLLVSFVGCGAEITEQTLESAQASIDEAHELFDAEQYEQALPVLDTVIAGRGLTPDQYTDAVLRRARCHCMTGDLESAAADLAEAEMGAPDMGQFYLTQAILFAKQGRAAESKKSLAAARRVDSRLKMPDL